MLCRNFERREIEGECLKDCGRRQSTFWPPNACTRSPVRSFVRLHFQKLLARLFALCGGRGRKRGRGPHSAWKTVRASETLRSDPSLPEGTWHSDAYILGLIGHGIRANKHRPSSRRVGEWNARRFQRIRGTHSTVTFPGPLESLFI